MKALIWLFTKRGSFLDWIHLIGLLYETDGQRLITFLNQISINAFESWELCAQSIFRFASHCVSNEVNYFLLQFKIFLFIRRRLNR